MKKLALFFVLLGFLGGQACSAYDEVENYCPKPPYAIDNGVGSFVTTLTGANFLTTKIAENRLAAALNKELDADFRVQIDTFGGNNLLNGKFKKLTAKAKNADSRGIHFTDIIAETLCEFNQVKYENDKLYFVESMVVKYSGKITSEDLKETIMSNEYVSALSRLSVTASGKSIAKVSNMNVGLEDNRLVMSYEVTAPMFFGESTHKVSFSAELEIEDGKISMCDVDFGNALTNVTMKPFLPMINKLNPFVYKVKSNNDYNSTVDVKTVKVINNEVYVEGIIVIPRNYDGQGA